MRKVHCRKCWQPIPLLTKRCDQCGEIDSLRFGKGLIEVFFYVALGAAAIGLTWWGVSFLYSSHGSITAIGPPLV